MRVEIVYPASGVDIFSRVNIAGFAFDAEVVYLTHRLGLSFRHSGDSGKRLCLDLVAAQQRLAHAGRSAANMVAGEFQATPCRFHVWFIWKETWMNRSGPPYGKNKMGSALESDRI